MVLISVSVSACTISHMSRLKERYSSLSTLATTRGSHRHALWSESLYRDGSAARAGRELETGLVSGRYEL